MKRSHGQYVGRSRKLKSKGRVSVTRQLAEFNAGETARISVNPSFPRGRVHLRFNHKIVRVMGKQGACSRIEFRDGNKRKELVIGNIHLERV
ncbi:50S ribosomal protein L21e [Candidatus Micrarchaeota archaeon]|nr:50S ribosomal protein L21e [Candidatus Micrarchaeota archaeon]